MKPIAPTSFPAFEHVLPHVDILKQCREHPTRTAIISAGREITYAELGAASARLAQYLLHAGVNAGEAVGVCLSARPEQLVAMLAIFRIGAVYLPLDPTHPPDLISYELREAEPRFVISEHAAAEHLDRAISRVLDIDAIAPALAQESDELQEFTVDLDSVAFLLFTSGTTGRPKGVQLTHRNLAQFLQSARAAYDFRASDAFCSIARYTFSISMFELLSPLTVGGLLYVSRREDVLRPEFLTELLDKVTVLHAGPSLLSRLSRHTQEQAGNPRTFPSLRHVSTGGDIVLPDVMERMKLLFPKAELFVIYGCTEISCMGTEYRIPLEEKCTKSYVGRPFPGVGVRLLDERGDAAPRGTVGEICFSGPGLAAGYLNRPEVEAEKFVSLDGVRHYRTGDLGRLDDDLQLEFLGRNDFQVQLRGMRVELVGIENTVRDLRLADECAATLRHFGEDDERLVAFVQRPHATPAEIRAQLATRFPDFMIPAHVVPVETLPLTVNGKLDRRGLQQLPIVIASAEPHGVARSSAEQRIIEVYAKTLGVPAVGAEDSFFDLGGHSLMAIEVAERLQAAMGVPVTPGDILQAPTARKLVEHLVGERLHKPIPLNACTAPERLFLVMGVHTYRALAKRLEPLFSVYGVYVEHELAFLGDGATAVPIPELAARYLDIIRREQPRGPYRLAGHSFGGLIGWEITRQLLEAGEDVTRLDMLDTIAPDYGWAGRIRKLGRLLRSGPVGQVRWLGRRLESWRSALLGVKRAEFGRHESGRFAEMELFREGAYRSVEVSYARNLQPLPVPTTLIVAGKRLARVPLAARDAGWNLYVPGIEHRIVDADHLDMLEEPGVRAVADILSESTSARESAA